MNEVIHDVDVPRNSTFSREADAGSCRSNPEANFAPVNPARLNLGSVVPSHVELIPAEAELKNIRITVALMLLVPLLVVAAGLALWLSAYIWIAFALFTALLVWVLWLIPRQVRFYAWGIDENAVYVCKGRFFQTVEMMPLARIQYADHDSGPIQRHWGQSSVTIKGAAAGSVEIVGVKEETSRKICERLMQLSADKLAGL